MFPSRFAGGAETSVFHLARGLAARGHAVRIITPDLTAPERTDERERVDRALAESGDARVLRFPFSIKLDADRRAFPSYIFGRHSFHRKFERSAREVLAGERPDVIHAQGLDAFRAARMMGSRWTVPAVATVRDYRALCPVAVCLHDQDRAPAGCGRPEFFSLPR
ncbi:MAG: glycosyltransferase [Deltaproteobacteria bacterium]|nr:glycosyltransferase [Deltaproteobacteria bacterium]